MRKKKSRFNKKLLLTATIATVIILVLLGLYFWHTHQNKSKATNNPAAGSTVNPNNSIDYSPAPKADNNANDSRKSSGNPTSTIDTYQAPANSGTFSVSISRAGVDSSSQNLQVATLINGVSSGTCTLNVHQAGQQTVSKSESVVLQVNSYVCPVMNIPLSQFPNKGSWNVTVTVESNSKTVSANWANNPVAL